jgi:periplasmic copper chaperone A
MILLRLFGLIAICVLSAAPAWAHSYRQGDIQIGHAWARATPSQATAAAVYMPFLNVGKQPDRLLAVSTPIATSAMLHASSTDNGINRMTGLENLLLPPQRPIALRSGGTHIMLMGLRRPLQVGERFPLILQFQQAGTITIEVIVQAVGTAAAH